MAPVFGPAAVVDGGLGASDELEGEVDDARSSARATRMDRLFITSKVDSLTLEDGPDLVIGLDAAIVIDKLSEGHVD